MPLEYRDRAITARVSATGYDQKGHRTRQLKGGGTKRQILTKGGHVPLVPTPRFHRLWMGGPQFEFHCPMAESPRCSKLTKAFQIYSGGEDSVDSREWATTAWILHKGGVLWDVDEWPMKMGSNLCPWMAAYWEGNSWFSNNGWTSMEEVISPYWCVHCWNHSQSQISTVCLCCKESWDAQWLCWLFSPS